MFKSHRKKQVIVDFGANVGISVFFFAKRYPNAEIYAYEADPMVFEYLKENVSRFDNGNIHLFNVAVSDHDGVINFIQEGADGGRFALGDEKGIFVDCQNVESILRDFNHIDMLKIDIEGAERVVMPAISSQLDKVDNIFLEYHSEKERTQCLTQLIEILKDYRLFIQSGFCPAQPLFELTDYMGFDLQLNIFGIKRSVS